MQIMLQNLVMLVLSLCIGNAHAVAKQQPHQRNTMAKAVASAKAMHKPVQRVAVRQTGGKHRIVRRAIAPPAPEVFNPDVLDIQSTAALVLNTGDGKVV